MKQTRLRLHSLLNWYNAQPWRHTRLWKLTVYSFVGLACLLILDLSFPPPKPADIAVSTVVHDRNGVPLRAFPVEDGRWRLKADLEKTDPAFIRALLAYEDERFYSHMGVDIQALLRASLNLIRAGEVVSGGSTITMQTARLLEPRKRNLGAKFFQIIRAFQLERRLTKQDILELYLTLAPYGGNIEGVRSASWAYFGKEPVQLTPDEIALLIALPQSPEARRPDLRPENAFKARERVLRRLARKNTFAEDRIEEAQQAIIPTRRNFPTYAWHVAEFANAHSQEGLSEVCVPIDLQLQTQMESLAAKVVKSADAKTQMAAIIIDIPSREVLASIGSADLKRAGGWIDLTRRYRSPGSTLKPFIYAMAFEDGVALPSTRISDLPTRFKSYQPENFDRTFRGDVTIAQALQHSLNIPAVQALEAVGPMRFVSSLSFAGTHPKLPQKPEIEVGLALALGGVGLTVQDLAVLYAALGDKGIARPLNWNCQAETQDEGIQFVSAQSAARVVDVLRSAPTPQGRMPSQLTQNAPMIAFKTGTSYGFRDAWAAGIANDLAIIVWIGNADGSPRPSQTGRKAALPVLFDAFDIAIQTLNRHARNNIGIDGQDVQKTPFTLNSFSGESEAPQILFPPDQSEIWFDKLGRGFTFAARGEGKLTWYVEGEEVKRNAYGESVWAPPKEGFYDIVVVDPKGQSQKSTVRFTQQAD